ncbi:MAG: ABC transporter ATP-binding protein [Candidatus Omnitrophica bacterium]|nr:ABC transporter ATP-binding protein [Candidatus Omnitrophota bacterium]
MADAVIDAMAVEKRFHPRAALWGRSLPAIPAVDGVTCRLLPGERFGIVGESGCGKTTLAKIMVGLLPPTRGEVRRSGRIQYVFQNPMNSLNPRMTVRETVGEGLVIHRLARGVALRRRVAELLEAVKLPASFAARYPRQLSGGERQRVGIARALSVEPDAVICDEPIASLDVSVGAQIIDLLRDLSQRRTMALLFISHDVRAVASLCERIAVMRRGRFVEVGPTELITTQPQQAYTQLLLRSAALDLDADNADHR